MIKLKSLLKEYETAHNIENKYYYRVHPKGDIRNVLKDGLYSYSPAEFPSSYIDKPEEEKWPDQEFDDRQTYRFYIATNEWELAKDRIRIRIPKQNLDVFDLQKDSLGDYYIDTGNKSKKILEPNQYDIQIGDKWIRADMVDPVMIRSWYKAHYKPTGYYKNKFNTDDEEDNIDL